MSVSLLLLSSTYPPSCPNLLPINPPFYPTIQAFQTPTINTLLQQSAFALQLTQIGFQLLSVIIPLYATMRPADKLKPDTKKPGKKGQGDANGEKKKAKAGDEEAVKLMDDSKMFTMVNTKAM